MHPETGPPRLPAGVGTLRAPKETGSDSRGVCAPLPVQPPCHHPLLLTDSPWLPVAFTPTRPLLQTFGTCPHPPRLLCRAPSSSWLCQAPPSPAPPPGLRGAARFAPFSLRSPSPAKARLHGVPAEPSLPAVATSVSPGPSALSLELVPGEQGVTPVNCPLSPAPSLWLPRPSGLLSDAVASLRCCFPEGPVWLQLRLVLPKPGGRRQSPSVYPGLRGRNTETRTEVTQRGSG